MATGIDNAVEVSPARPAWRVGRWAVLALLFAFLVLACSLPLSFGLAWWMNYPSNRVVAKWTQPETIDYKSFGPYELYVMEGGLNWTLFGTERRYYLFIGRAEGEPSHGHAIDYSFHPGGTDLAAHIQASKVEWSDDGVTFVEASGHRLFVPKKMFIGGR